MPKEDIRLVNEHQRFLEELLMETQQSLGYARSVKEAKFIHHKLLYLRQKLKDMNSVGNGHAKRKPSKSGRKSRKSI